MLYDDVIFFDSILEFGVEVIDLDLYEFKYALIFRQKFVQRIVARMA